MILAAVALSQYTRVTDGQTTDYENNLTLQSHCNFRLKKTKERCEITLVDLLLLN